MKPRLTNLRCDHNWKSFRKKSTVSKLISLGSMLGLWLKSPIISRVFLPYIQPCSLSVGGAASNFGSSTGKNDTMRKNGTEKIGRQFGLCPELETQGLCDGEIYSLSGSFEKCVSLEPSSHGNRNVRSEVQARNCVSSMKFNHQVHSSTSQKNRNKTYLS